MDNLKSKSNQMQIAFINCTTISKPNKHIGDFTSIVGHNSISKFNAISRIKSRKQMQSDSGVGSKIKSVLLGEM